jgi:glycogen debranching enzyme
VIAQNASEWLEADGAGGFASGTVNMIRTRRYHGLLLVATTPPTGRVMLVNGYDAWIESPAGRVDLSAQRYQGDVVHPRGHEALASFSHEPWPTWRHALPGGATVVTELLAAGPGQTLVRWTLAGWLADATLHVRPLLSGRDYHGLQRENGSLDFHTEQEEGHLVWRTYAHVPAVASVANGVWRDEPQWYRNFLYTSERERGLDDTEDLASPGVLTFDLSAGPAVWLAGTRPALTDAPRGAALALHAIDVMTQARERRRRLGDALARAADAYIVQRGVGRTIVAGYPWFTDWGRDTFISLRGLCMATERLEDARDILLEWANTVSEGMLPNRFPDGGEQPEYNAIDASLWYVVATSELLEAAAAARRLLSPLDRLRLETVIVTVLEGLARGTRFGIRADIDDYPSDREARGNSSPVDQRARSRRAPVHPMGAGGRACALIVRASLLARRDRQPLRCRRRRSREGHVGREHPTQPDLRDRRPSAPGPHGTARTTRRRPRRERVADATRTAFALAT